MDSLRWKWIDSELGDFGKEDRNIRLGLATDGVNPYSVKKSRMEHMACLPFELQRPVLAINEKAFHIAFHDHPWQGKCHFGNL